MHRHTGTVNTNGSVGPEACGMKPGNDHHLQSETNAGRKQSN